MFICDDCGEVFEEPATYYESREFWGAPGLPEAHYIRRSQLGRGIEQNIVTLCRECHREFDEGKKHNEYKEKIQTYLDLLYPDFSDYDRIYHKW